MICIACEKEFEKLAKSHVISNFFRKRMTGFYDDKGSKKFKFTWVGHRDLPKQDLPKPNLIFATCDSDLGSLVERDIPKLLMLADLERWDEWNKLPIVYIHPANNQCIFESKSCSPHSDPKCPILICHRHMVH